MISVIIRTHNQTNFLGEALRSLQGQTRQPDEIVIVDDGSLDDVTVVVRQLAPAAVVVRHDLPRGAAEAANAGVRRSRGDLIVLLDADDRMSRTYLGCLESALADRDVHFAYAGSKLFGAVDRWEPPVPFSIRELARENFISISAMFRREVFDHVSGFSCELDDHGFEDWDFWLKAAGAGYVGRPVEGCWLEYRRHLGGSRNIRPRWKVVRSHLVIRRRHPKVVRLGDVVIWTLRSCRRTLLGSSTRIARASRSVT